MKNKDIDKKIADAILERPNEFSICNRHFYLYPMTLGKMMLFQRIMSEFDLKDTTHQTEEFVKKIRDNKEVFSRLVAVLTLKGSGIFDNKDLDDTIKFISENAEIEDIATLIIMSFDDSYNEFVNHLGLDKEMENLSIVKQIKGEGNSIDFNAKSLYGTIIDPVCERYGWTLDYVLWGISYTNLRMLMADTRISIYLSDDEKKKVSYMFKDDVIRADDPRNFERIRSMSWK